MSAFRSPAAADHVLACLRRVTPGPASQRRRSDVLDDVLQAYGDLDVDEICRVVTTYAREHGAELRDILARREGDYRRPPLLDDPAIFCVLERLVLPAASSVGLKELRSG